MSTILRKVKTLKKENLQPISLKRRIVFQLIRKQPKKPDLLVAFL